MISSELYLVIENNSQTFNLSTTPPEGGVTVSVDATRLEDFNLDAVEVTGGEITEVGEDGFQFKITSTEASINLPILDDANEEFLEEAVFTLESGEGYQVNPEADGGTFTLVNLTKQVPTATEEVSEPNDTIELAQPLGLNDVYSKVGIEGSIDYDNHNSYEINEEDTLYVDFTEDTETTFSFDLNGEIPEEGVLIYADSSTNGAIGEFDISGAETSGGVLSTANFGASGFFFRAFEDGASITVNAFDDTTNPEIEPEDALEGIEDFTFSLVDGPGYSIAENSSVSFTIAENADSVALPEEPED